MCLLATGMPTRASVSTLEVHVPFSHLSESIYYTCQLSLESKTIA
jgi:hypothetical protein